jgi:isoquinoline 1-oxidoreductase beta subunit
VRISRRGLIAGTAAGGGLLLAWMLFPRSYGAPLPTGPGEHGFGAWLTIGSDGVVTVAVPQLEMGQGVTTLLPQVVAQELGADWRQVAAAPAPLRGAYANLPLAARWSPPWKPG